jgi:hypothetical protein
MWRVPIWETFITGKKTKKNPKGIYAGHLITKNLLTFDSYKETKEIVKWLDDVNFICQHKIVNVDKIAEIIKTTKGFYPKGSYYYWKKYLLDDSVFKRKKK